MFNFWVKKPKNHDSDPDVPISRRVNIKIWNCYILEPSKNVMEDLVGGVHGWPLWLPFYKESDTTKKTTTTYLLRFMSIVVPHRNRSCWIHDILRTVLRRIAALKCGFSVIHTLSPSGLTHVSSDSPIQHLDSSVVCIGIHFPQRTNLYCQLLMHDSTALEL